MRLIRYLVLLYLGIHAFPALSQINFLQSTYEEALQKAREEKKGVFIDFYTDWCGPCKWMAREVFTLPEVGDYFNRHFVCLQLNAEASENKELVKKYQVTAYPWMIFADATGKQLRKVCGAVPGPAFIHEAKIATGEELSFEQLYEKYRKNKKDFKTVQILLLQARSFMSGIQGYEQEKWAIRIEAIFEEYVKNKGLKNMINPEDFYLISLFHTKLEKNDPIFDFLVEHYSDFTEFLDKEQFSRYLIALDNKQIIQMCKAGNLDYKKRLERLDGDLKEIYAEMKFGLLTVKEAVTLLADANYYLYRKDEDRFFENIDQYLAGVGESLMVDDYTQPIEDLYTLYQGKISEKAMQKCIVWIGKVLEKEMDVQLRVRLLIMLGECYQGTGDQVKAKQSYNQSFLLTPQIEHLNFRQQLQHMIQEKLKGV